ncbi:hypothetical protein [Prevotella sp. P5-64]|uniref:hypothetical protein n=1 Tax=Prevotella sp. P5-64 TaxID=2024226 RepID=UPI001303454F|nr:hypothetical protein [Prevotella sp. P5-64]
MAIRDINGDGTDAEIWAEDDCRMTGHDEFVAFSTFLTIAIAARQKEMATFAPIII